MTEDMLLATDGRLPGRRGRATRDRLLDATARLLATRAYRELKVVDIAREVGSSPATFYQYFSDVEGAIVVLVRRAVKEGSAMLAAPAAPANWRDRDTGAAAEELVDAFVSFWRDHAAVMRIIDLEISEGDLVFRELRNDLLGPVVAALAEVIRERGGEASDIEPTAEAAALISMLAHVSDHQRGLGAWGAALPEIRRSMIAHVAWAVRRPEFAS